MPVKLILMKFNSYRSIMQERHKDSRCHTPFCLHVCPKLSADTYR